MSEDRTNVQPEQRSLYGRYGATFVIVSALAAPGMAAAMWWGLLEVPAALNLRREFPSLMVLVVPFLLVAYGGGLLPGCVAAVILLRRLAKGKPITLPLAAVASVYCAVATFPVLWALSLVERAMTTHEMPQFEVSWRTLGLVLLIVAVPPVSTVPPALLSVNILWGIWGLFSPKQPGALA